MLQILLNRSFIISSLSAGSCVSNQCLLRVTPSYYTRETLISRRERTGEPAYNLSFVVHDEAGISASLRGYSQRGHLLHIPTSGTSTNREDGGPLTTVCWCKVATSCLSISGELAVLACGFLYWRLWGLGNETGDATNSHCIGKRDLGDPSFSNKWGPKVGCRYNWIREFHVMSPILYYIHLIFISAAFAKVCSHIILL